MLRLILQAQCSEAHQDGSTPPGWTLASPIPGEVMLLGCPCPAPSSGAAAAAKRGSQPSHQLPKETDPAQYLELLHPSLLLHLILRLEPSWLKMIPWERPGDAACSTMAQDLSRPSLTCVPETKLLPTAGQLSVAPPGHSQLHVWLVQQ